VNVERQLHTEAARMDRSLAITLGIAAIAHAIALAVVRPSVRHDAARVVAVDSQDVIELTEEAIAPRAPETATTAGTTSDAPPAKVAMISKSKAKDLVAIAVPETSAGPEVTSPAPTASGGEPTKSASKIPSLINLDSPGSHGVIWPTSAPDVPVSKDVAAAKKLDAQLKGALDANDAANGSGFGGPVVSAAHSAAGGTSALGWATFDVTTDALGSVTMVRVVDFGGGGDSKSWQGVAKGIQSDLGTKKLRVPTGAGGVAVRVRVEAAMKYPSGATKPLSPSVGAGTVGFDFDVSDIGQSPKRIVQVRIVGESRI